MRLLRRFFSVSRTIESRTDEGGYRLSMIYHRKVNPLSFRVTNAPKRIFWSVDHQTDADIIERAYPTLRAAGISLNNPADRKKFVADYRKAKLQLIVEQSNLEGYELLQDDQLPDTEVNLSTWLIKNQTKALASEDMVFMDFRAPIEIEAFLVPDSVM